MSMSPVLEEKDENVEPETRAASQEENSNVDVDEDEDVEDNEINETAIVHPRTQLNGSVSEAASALCALK